MRKINKFVFVAAIAIVLSVLSCASNNTANSDGAANPESKATVYVVEFSPLEKTDEYEQLLFVATDEECYDESQGWISVYMFDFFKVFVEGEDSQAMNDDTVRISVEMRQVSTGELLYEVGEFEGEISDPWAWGGFMFMDGPNDYPGWKEVDDGDYEFVVTSFSVQTEDGEFKELDESEYEVRMAE